MITFRMLFTKFANQLTRWITVHMYERYRDNRDNYSLTRVGNDKYLVTHKISEDVHEVSTNFQCTCNGKPCWQQKYAGCLCVHGLIVCIHRLSLLQRDRQRQHEICDEAILSCNSNWHRELYRESVTGEIKAPPAPEDSFVLGQVNRTMTELRSRFASIIPYIPVQEVKALLNQLTERGFAPQETVSDVVCHVTHSKVECQ